MGVLTPILAFLVLRYIGRFDIINASAIAAHYGSVSAVTFIAAITYSELQGFQPEGFMPTLLALLEVPRHYGRAADSAFHGAGQAGIA